jgi:hypothetical protein
LLVALDERAALEARSGPDQREFLLTSASHRAKS